MGKRIASGEASFKKGRANSSTSAGSMTPMYVMRPQSRCHQTMYVSLWCITGPGLSYVLTGLWIFMVWVAHRWFQLYCFPVVRRSPSTVAGYDTLPGFLYRTCAWLQSTYSAVIEVSAGASDTSPSTSCGVRLAVMYFTNSNSSPFVYCGRLKPEAR